MNTEPFNYLTRVMLMTALTLGSTAAMAGQKPKQAKPPVTPNTLTAQEVKAGFTLLFDGTSLEHFKGVSKEARPQGAWIVQDGQIICTSQDKRPEGAGGSIVTKEQYADFDFRFEYKLDPDFKGDVNSGIKYFAYPGKELGLEYQIYDHDREISTKHALADLYDLLPAKERPANPRGQWNTVRIVAQGKRVQHWLNGKKVLQFTRGSKAFRGAVAESKFKDQDKFGEAEQGPLLLQDHGGGIAFRTLRIKVTDR
ncbi:MAG: DUF1080 domain-containing protein [Phycisphaerae bacterium]|nr:DUF1080 domain-containing protein [Phycisphaerae bacterium]